jgi:hypothetical protein
MKTLEELVRELPPDMQEEVREFAEFLLEKRAKGKKKYLSQSWAGGLKEFRSQYTSLELQKKSLEGRGD